MGLPVEVNPLLASGGGYTVQRSLRFRSSASAYLNRTPASATNRQKFTLSLWIKRGVLSVNQAVFSASDGTQSNEFLIYLATNDTLNIQQTVGGTSAGQISCATNAVFRDPSAWYHMVLAIDTTQATSTNRLLLYINGVSQSFSSYSVGSSINTWVNNTNAHAIAKRSDASLYLDGYLSEINFIDGQQLTPSSFGAYDANGVWQPKGYAGTYGTNGYYLKFINTTSTTTLCYDYSGNNNNWTPNNISLTAGVGYDSMIDSPTNYADGGTGRGNYCVLNPLKAYGGVYNGNLSQYYPVANWTTGTSTFYVSSGKWYWEVIYTNLTGASYGIHGIVDNNFAQQTLGNYPGVSPTSYGYFNSGGTKYNNATPAAYGAGYVDNDVIGVALDMDVGTLTFYKNGVSQGTAFTGLSGSFTPAVGTYGSVVNANFGQRPFAYTPPTGFKALNTQNLTTPTISNGAQYMAATTYIGNGGTLPVTNGGNNNAGTTFQPDFVWLKGRSVAYANGLYNVLSGVNKFLSSNSTNAETTNDPDGYLSAFNANGFTLSAGSSSSNTWNQNNATYIGWQWKAGGTGVTNTSGSITSTVSANTSAGFSVVTFTSTASTQSVGHGLGVTPSLIILKNRSTTGNWGCYHQSLGVNSYINLNSTAAAATVSNIWAVSSTTFTPDRANLIGGSGITCVAYCFAPVAGYSAFGSYTGNGSADGPFIYLGFRPRYLFVKLTSGAENWYCQDSSRGTYNANTFELFPNLANAEQNSSAYNTDFLSNGFKLRTSDTSINTSSGTYIYAAFAENPFKSSRAR
jgi:hypothetical protein